jgi:hypothetical protein
LLKLGSTTLVSSVVFSFSELKVQSRLNEVLDFCKKEEEKLSSFKVLVSFKQRQQWADNENMRHGRIQQDQWWAETTLETSEDLNYARNELRCRQHSKRVKM